MLATVKVELILLYRRWYPSERWIYDMKNFQFSIFNFQTKRKSGGFTIIESLVAIAILVLAITATASAIQTSISSYIFSKDQIIAFYLAQEGLEQVRNIRDENALVGRNWLTGLSANSSDPCYFGNACIVDPLDS